MRCRAVLTLGAAFALCGSPAAAQDETRWVRVFADSADVVSIDTVSVTPLGDETYRIWERSVARASGEARVLARVDVDCRLRLTRTVVVAPRGFAPVPAFDEEREWTEILPGTMIEAGFRYVCSADRRAGERPSP